MITGTARVTGVSLITDHDWVRLRIVRACLCGSDPCESLDTYPADPASV